MSRVVFVAGADLPFHPLANVFPLIEGDEFSELVADVRANGLDEPIVLLDGQILDGRNRYRACAAAGIDCGAVEFSGADPLRYVVSKNLRRRHLSTSQRAMVADELARLEVGRPESIAEISAISQSEAGTLLNVSRESVQFARTLREHGAPELVDAVKRGEIAISTAAEVARHTGVAEQRFLVARGREEILARAKEIRAEEREEKRVEARISFAKELQTAEQRADDTAALLADLAEDEPPATKTRALSEAEVKSDQWVWFAEQSVMYARYYPAETCPKTRRHRKAVKAVRDAWNDVLLPFTTTSESEAA